LHADTLWCVVCVCACVRVCVCACVRVCGVSTTQGVQGVRGAVCAAVRGSGAAGRAGIHGLPARWPARRHQPSQPEGSP
jgi:hypothetical protein